MNWDNLKQNKCPKCNKDFTLNLTKFPIAGSSQTLAHACGFSISVKRYSQIVSSQVNQELEDKFEIEEEEW